MKYAIVKQQKKNQEWEVCPEYGIFDKAILAMRHVITLFEPSLSKADDRLIRKHWRSYRINHSIKIQPL